VRDSDTRIKLFATAGIAKLRGERTSLPSADDFDAHAQTFRATFTGPPRSQSSIHIFMRQSEGITVRQVPVEKHQLSCVLPSPS